MKFEKTEVVVSQFTVNNLLLQQKSINIIKQS
jgi:hypothetical protein